MVRSGLHGAPLIHKHIGTFPIGSVRVNPSHLTSDDEIETFTDAVHLKNPGEYPADMFIKNIEKIREHNQS